MPPEPRTQDMATTISVSEELADTLYARKRRGESYEDVIYRLIEKAGQYEEMEERADESDSDNAPVDAQLSEADDNLTVDTTGSEKTELDRLIDEIVADDVLPGSGAKLEKRREALRATVEYLREHRTAEPKNFKNDVYPAHPAEYTVGEDPSNSWWKNCIYKGLRALAERSTEIQIPDQTGEWRYTGDLDE